jgi:hypothetical protein
MEILGGPPKLIEMTDGLPLATASTAAALMPEMMVDVAPVPSSFMTLIQWRVAFFATPKTLPPIVPATWVPSGSGKGYLLLGVGIGKGKGKGKGYSRPFPSAQGRFGGKQLARPANS